MFAKLGLLPIYYRQMFIVSKKIVSLQRDVRRYIPKLKTCYFRSSPQQLVIIFSGIIQMIVGESQFQKIMDDGQSSIADISKDNQQRTYSLFITKMLVVLLLLIIIAISVLLLLGKQPISNKNTNSLRLSFNGQQQLSKILWVQTETPSGQSSMVKEIINNNLIHFARESGYQTRVVNNINAYDWLSPSTAQFVQQAKKKSLFSIDVSEILRVALLYEHGGISIKHSCILNGKLDWVEDIFRMGQNTPGVEYFGKDKSPEILLFYKQKDTKRVYEDDVIIARRGSKLLQEALMEMSQFLIKGEMKDIILYSLGDQSVLRENYNSLFIDLVNYKQNSTFFGLMSIDKTKGNFMMSYESVENLKTDMLQDPKSFQLKNGKKHIIQANFNALSDTFLQMLEQKYSSLIKKNTILRSKIIDISSNSWMTNQTTETRQVHFCIISLKVLQKDYYQSASRSVAQLQKQTYSAWKAVYFTDGEQESPLNFEKGEVLKSSGSQGIDLQHAATFHCDPKDVAVLLNYDQKFEKQDGLQTIAKVMIQRKYFGAFLSAKNQSSNINPTFATKEIKRQLGKADPALFREIADNFRVFRISSYRFIPQRALQDNDENYYDSEIVFLSLLEMGWGFQSCEGKNEIAYHIKKIEEKVDIPKYRAHIPDVVILMTDSKELDLSRPQYYLKYKSERICDSMKQFHAKTHRALEDFFAFNDGSSLETNSKTEIIPKKVHTIIFGEEMLNLKYRLVRQSKKTLLSYEHLIWQQANITRANFPYTYDIIMAIRKSNVLVRELVKHQQVIINLMRLQILYWHGGIYLDPHYLIFNQQQLEKMLVFEAVLPAMPFPNSYSVEMNSLIATVQHYKPILDLIDPILLSSIDLYSKDAVEQTGAIMLGRLLANQGISNTIFQSSVEYFQPDYPSITKANQNQTKKSCKTGPNDAKTSFLGYVYDGDCRAKYGWALGVSL